MERSVRTKRIYPLGNYANIEIEDTIVGVPEHLALDVKFISELTLLQLLRIESTYNRYLDMKIKTKDLQPDEIIQLLEEQKSELIGSIITKIKEI